MGLSAFLVRLDAFIRSRGTDYVSAATHPDAAGETLDSAYSVTITKSPAGTKYGQAITKYGQAIPI